MTISYLTAPTNGPRFVSIEEVAAIAHAAKQWDRLGDFGLMTLYQGMDSDGRAFRLTQTGTDGSAIIESLPITLTDPRAWA